MSTIPLQQVTQGPPAPENGRTAHPAGTQPQLAATLNSLVRLADLQVAIWLSGVRRLVLQLVVVAVLGVLALLCLIVTVLFVYAAVFHILTDFLRMPTAWALLVFAGAHAGLAAVLVVAVIVILNRGRAGGKMSAGAS